MDQAGLLRHREELRRRHRGAVGTMPAQQGLCTPEGAERIHLRLEVQRQFAVFQRTAEAAFELHPGVGDRLHRRLVPVDGVATAALGLESRHLGVADDIQPGGFVGEQGDPDACTDAEAER